MQRHINILEEMPRSDASHAIGGLHQIVPGLAGMFTAEPVGEDEGSGKLTGVHNEARAVGGPVSVDVHKSPTPSAEGC